MDIVFLVNAVLVYAHFERDKKIKPLACTRYIKDAADLQRWQKESPNREVCQIMKLAASLNEALCKDSEHAKRLYEYLCTLVEAAKTMSQTRERALAVFQGNLEAPESNRQPIG